MLAFANEIDQVIQQIRDLVHPSGIYLFGSCAKGCVRVDSDIDLCLIMDTGNKRETIRDLQLVLNSEHEVDLVIYTPNEWEKHHRSPSTFAHHIFRTGVNING